MRSIAMYWPRRPNRDCAAFPEHLPLDAVTHVGGRQRAASERREREPRLRCVVKRHIGPELEHVRQFVRLLWQRLQ
jgi:hypothetical protein